jgi:hypothetical protein
VGDHIVVSQVLYRSALELTGMHAGLAAGGARKATLMPVVRAPTGIDNDPKSLPPRLAVL